MTKSIGMRINGDDAIGTPDGANLKSMVCDSFTQYNEAGIGVSLTNNAYAQLVSIFTINCDIGIFAGSGAQCDLTNSNSSFGNFGLVAAGLGSTQYTGKVRDAVIPGDNSDVVVGKGVTDTDGDSRDHLMVRQHTLKLIWIIILMLLEPEELPHHYKNLLVLRC